MPDARSQETISANWILRRGGTDEGQGRLFAGPDRGGVHAAAMYTLIGTARLNNVDPQAWLAAVLVQTTDTPQDRLDNLLPWNWSATRQQDRAA